jgi:hypothetical protein
MTTAKSFNVSFHRKKISSFSRCAIPGFDNDTYTVQNQDHAVIINMTIPPSDDDNFKYNECYLYPFSPNSSYIYDNYSRPINASTHKCDKWVYDRTVFHENVVTEVMLKSILFSVYTAFFLKKIFYIFFFIPQYHFVYSQRHLNSKNYIISPAILLYLLPLCAGHIK